MRSIAGITGILCSLLHLLASAQNAPVSTVESTITNLETVTVSITATNFSDIRSCNLKLLYDPAIASAVSVSAGPQLGGMLSSNVNIPGTIGLGWFAYPARTLPDNSVLFNITFTRVTPGITSITWDVEDAYACMWKDENLNLLNDIPKPEYYFNGTLNFLSPDAPLSSLPELEACQQTLVDVPVVVNDFNNIGSYVLTLAYEPEALNYLSFNNNSGFPGFSVDAGTPGTIQVQGLSPDSEGFSLAGGSVLFTLVFSTTGLYSSLNWVNSEDHCQFTGPAPHYYILNHQPVNQFYIDGSVTGLTVPDPAGAISGPPGNNVCAGQEEVIFSVEPVPGADSYEWSFPYGANIIQGASSNVVTVSFTNDALSGNASVMGLNDCGYGQASSPYFVEVNTAPVITSQPQSPPPVTAGQGMASFNIIATGASLSFQWQEYDGSWANIENNDIYQGASTSSLLITNPPVSMDGNRYRCIVSGMCDPEALSDGEAMLTVVPMVGIYFLGNRDVLRIFANTCMASNQTMIEYFLPQAGSVSIEIFNLKGVQLESFYQSFQPKGVHRLKPEPMPPGIYIARLLFSQNNQTKISTIKFSISP